MMLRSKFKQISPLILCFALAACATGDYAAQLSQPNFGLRVLPSFNLDSSALMNGVYAPKFLQSSCIDADHGCSPQLQQRWAEPLPR